MKHIFSYLLPLLFILVGVGIWFGFQEAGYFEELDPILSGVIHFVSLVCILMGIMLFKFFRKYWDKINRIQKQGFPAIGKIVNHRMSPMTLNNVEYMEIEVEYNGYRTWIKFIDPNKLPTKIGDQIQLKYNSQNPIEVMVDEEKYKK